MGLFFVGDLGFVCWCCIWWGFFGGGILFVKFGWFFSKKELSALQKTELVWFPTYQGNYLYQLIPIAQGKPLFSSSIYLNEGMSIPCLNADGT